MKSIISLEKDTNGALTSCIHQMERLVSGDATLSHNLWNALSISDCIMIYIPDNFMRQLSFATIHAGIKFTHTEWCKNSLVMN